MTVGFRFLNTKSRQRPATLILLVFDNGHLKDDCVGSQRLLNSLLRVIREDLKDSALIHTPTYWGRIVNVFWDSWSYIGGYFTDPLVKVHNSVWKRIVEVDFPVPKTA